MPLDHPFFAFAGFAIAVAVASMLDRSRPFPDAGSGRYAAIDGLRGFLAFGVFLHHALIWKLFLQTGLWVTPPSHLFAHLGNSSVAMFFMVTAFLFTGKVIESRTRPIHWPSLYAGRVCRLMPLYLVVVGMIVVLALLSTGPHLRVPVLHLVDESLRWGGLAIFGMPDINGYDGTWRIAAGVPWTLGYEVFFYAALPLLAWLAGRRASLWAVVGGSAMMVVIHDGAYLNGGMPLASVCLAFGFGIVAAYAVRRPSLTAFASSRKADVLVVASVAVAIVVNPTGTTIPSILLCGPAFILLAAGADLFGLLRTRAARFLGELSYGVYLLHGIVLYVAIVHVLGVARVAALSSVEYWAVVYALVPCVLIAATIGYRWVERPGIDFGRRRLSGRGTRALDIPAIP